MKRLLAVTAIVLAAACTDPCVNLAKKICACQPTKTLQSSCETDASNEASRINVSSGANNTCSKLVDKCNCADLTSEDPQVSLQAKQNCGLARIPPP